MDLWQLASARTMSSWAMTPWPTIWLEVVEPLRTKKVQSAPKMRAALRSESPGRADVVEPGAERRGGDAEVGAQEVFAEELVELHADGVLEEGDAAHVAGGVPGVGALVGVLLELAEVGREELLVVALDGEVDAVGDEGGGVAEEVDVLVDLLDDFERELGDEGAVGDEEDGDLLVAAADGAEDLEGGAFVELVVAFEVPVEEDGGVGGVGGDEGEAVLGRGGADDLVAFFA